MFLLQLSEFNDIVVMSSRFGEEDVEKIPVSEVPIPPLGEILELNRDGNFSLFIPQHRKIAGKLINIFLGKTSI